MLNGIDEIDRLDFYYHLADLLIKDGATACILFPFPGHLTRFPLAGRFAERPFQRFMINPADLFRQYLRAMVEVHWLMSALAPVTFYSASLGTGLLEENEDPNLGRCNSGILSQAIANAWTRIHERTKTIDPSNGLKDSTKRRNAFPELAVDLQQLLREEVTRTNYRTLTAKIASALAAMQEQVIGGEMRQSEIRQSVETLRELVGWRSVQEPPTIGIGDQYLPPPFIHLVGHGLGAGLAQSVFFTWPLAISSCTSLSLGSMAGAQEKWRVLTRSLKYELASSMLEGRLRLDTEEATPLASKAVSIMGIPVEYFTSYFRLFNEIFLQEDQASYRSRVSEFSGRLLFIVAGHDPMVNTQSISDAGITILKIGDQDGPAGISVEKEEANFWLPAVASLLLPFAERSGKLLSRAVQDATWNPDSLSGDEEYGGIDEKWRLRRVVGEVLDSGRFQSELIYMVAALERGAYLFGLFNQVPPVLLGRQMLYRKGTTPHYEDRHVRLYWERQMTLSTLMLRGQERLSIVLPAGLMDWFAVRSPILSSSITLSKSRISTTASRQDVWNDFVRTWAPTGCLYRFDPKATREPSDGPLDALEKAVRLATKNPLQHPILTCLPGVWIWLSPVAVEETVGMVKEQAAIVEGLTAFAEAVYEEQLSRLKGGRQISLVALLISREEMRVVRVAESESGSELLGERVWNPAEAIELLLHSALAFARSQRCHSPGELGEFDDDNSSSAAASKSVLQGEHVEGPSKIFLSHADEDRAVARRLASTLEKLGWSVWWDEHIRSGTPFDEAIEAKLQEAKCVLVLWSHSSVSSDWVRSEAYRAVELKTMIPLCIQSGVRVPLRFNRFQVIDLSDAERLEESASFERLVRDITRLVGPGTPP